MSNPKKFLLGVFCLTAFLTLQSKAAAPYAFTQAAFFSSDTNAVLQAMVTPNGSDTSAWFEWGTDTNYGNRTDPISVGTGNQVVYVTNSLDVLLRRTTYHFRVVASNADATVYGADKFFARDQRVWSWGYLPALLPLTNVVGLAAGSDYSMALTANHRIVAWGNNTYGENNISPAASNVIQIAGGVGHALALRRDGTVVAWGSSYVGQTNVPAGLSNVISIAAGGYYGMALKNDGSLAMWGGGFGPSSIPSAATNIVAISGGYPALALRNDGAVFAWGSDNFFGSITNVPPGLSNVIAISSGTKSCFAIKNDASVVGWGSGYSLTKMPAGLQLSAICADSNALALTINGTVLSWGDNYASQTNVPTALTNAVGIALGSYHSMALGNNAAPVATSQAPLVYPNCEVPVTLAATDINNDILTYRIATLPTNGTLFQFTGSARGAAITVPDTFVTDISNRVVYVPFPNTFGVPSDSFQFIVNDGLDDSQPGTVLINEPGAPLVATLDPTLVTQTNAQLNGMVLPKLAASAWFEWGANTNYGNQTAPVSLAANTKIVYLTNQITGLVPNQMWHCRLVASNVAGINYGADKFFAHGKKLAAFGGFPSPPVPCTNAVAVAGGSVYFGLALTSDRNILAWPFSYPTAVTTNIPPNATNFVAIAATASTALGLTADGKLISWGASFFPSVPAAATNVVAIAGGPADFMALRKDGTVVRWGTGTTVDSSASNVCAIAVGDSRYVALRIDGTVVAWGTGGYNNRSPIPPAGLSNIVAVASGGDNIIALHNDHTVTGWGLYPYVPTNTVLDDITAVTIAQDVYTDATYLTRSDGSFWRWNNNRFAAPIAGVTNVIACSVGPSSTTILIADNMPPIATSYTNDIPSNRDGLIKLHIVEPNADPLTCTITALPTAGTLYQNNNGARGPAITSPNTIVTDPGLYVIYAPATNTYGPPYDKFTFSGTDGQSDSATATNTIDVFPVPVATTLPPISVSSSNATLNGSVIPLAAPTGAWFEFGTNTQYGVTNQAGTFPAGTGARPCATSISGLQPLTTYHYRIVATNYNGFAFGNDVAFTTPVPAMQLISGISAQGDSFQITFAGLSNATYTVLSATDPAGPWVQCGPATQPSPGVFQFIDALPTNAPTRFYQVQSP